VIATQKPNKPNPTTPFLFLQHQQPLLSSYVWVSYYLACSAFALHYKIAIMFSPFFLPLPYFQSLSRGWVLQLIISRFFPHIFAYSSSEFVPLNLRIMVGGFDGRGSRDILFVNM